MFLLFSAAVAAIVGCGSTEQAFVQDYASFVEPRIGTAHCRYFHFAPGAMPFGMAKPGPATNAHLGNKDGWEATGYDYRDGSIEGFPCTHEYQPGAWYVISSMGLFDVAGLNALTPTFSLGSCLFDRVTVRLSPKYYSGKKFTIETIGNSLQTLCAVAVSR